MSDETSGKAARGLVKETLDRVRFEEEALALADQVYQVARHLAGSREEAEDLMQETYAHAFRNWRSYQASRASGGTSVVSSSTRMPSRAKRSLQRWVTSRFWV